MKSTLIKRIPKKTHKILHIYNFFKLSCFPYTWAEMDHLIWLGSRSVVLVHDSLKKLIGERSIFLKLYFLLKFMNKYKISWIIILGKRLYFFLHLFKYKQVFYDLALNTFTPSLGVVFKLVCSKSFFIQETLHYFLPNTIHVHVKVRNHFDWRSYSVWWRVFFKTLYL